MFAQLRAYFLAIAGMATPTNFHVVVTPMQRRLCVARDEQFLLNPDVCRDLSLLRLGVSDVLRNLWRQREPFPTHMVLSEPPMKLFLQLRTAGDLKQEGQLRRMRDLQIPEAGFDGRGVADLDVSICITDEVHRLRPAWF